jgi:very-short-patch-repair endonuclease
MKPILTDAAKELRKNATEAEKFLWQRLHAKQLHGFKFRRQEQIGRFIVDFVCYERKLIVEADGGQHAVELEKDAERTAWLHSQGFKVLRFWNHEILTNLEGVLMEIEQHLNPPSP